MSLLNKNELKEQQRINELQLKINREKQKLDKKLTRQKILLGSFMIDLLENNKVEGLGRYTAESFRRVFDSGGGSRVDEGGG